MVDIEIFLDSSAWNQSWLLNQIDITSSSHTEIFSGIVISETLEKIDHKTMRCLLTVAHQLPDYPEEFPAVITANINHYPDIKILSPSAGTSWPLPESSEILVSFIENNSNKPIILGSLFNHNKSDPISTQNASQHILRANPNTELLVDDLKSQLKFTHKQNSLNLTQDINIENPVGNIFIETQKNIFYQSQLDTHETTESNYIRTITKNFSLNTQAGNIKFNTEKNIEISAEQNINIQANQDIYLESKNLLQLDSKNTVALLGSESLSIESDGNISADTANQDLYIMAENHIKITQNGNTIEIKDGVINFNAPQIVVSGQPILRVKPTSPG